MPHSEVALGRVAARRAATVTQILDHAEAILNERGAGAVTISEIARRMRMRAPSIYKYFESLNAVYDALFARGQALLIAYVEESIREREPGLDSLLEGSRAFARWTTREVGLASLMFWRPVPGFRPSASTYAVAQELVRAAREQLAAAVRRGELSDDAGSDSAYRLLTVLLAGIFSQQAANEPGAGFEDGMFTSLTEQVLQMFVMQFPPTTGKDGP